MKFLKDLNVRPGLILMQKVTALHIFTGDHAKGC